jgi:hypothetical protein
MLRPHPEMLPENAELKKPVKASENPIDAAEKPAGKLAEVATADAPCSVENSPVQNTRACPDLLHTRAFRVLLKQPRTTARSIDSTKLITAVGAGVICAAAAPIVAPLGLIGFSSTGVVAGLSFTICGHQKSTDTPQLQ